MVIKAFFKVSILITLYFYSCPSSEYSCTDTTLQLYFYSCTDTTFTVVSVSHIVSKYT